MLVLSVSLFRCVLCVCVCVFMHYTPALSGVNLPFSGFTTCCRYSSKNTDTDAHLYLLSCNISTGRLFVLCWTERGAGNVWNIFNMLVTVPSLFILGNMSFYLMLYVCQFCSLSIAFLCTCLFLPEKQCWENSIKMMLDTCLLFCALSQLADKSVKSMLMCSAVRDCSVFSFLVDFRNVSRTSWFCM